MPSAICHDDILDYFESKKLSKEFPTSFRVIRYEDLALNPLKSSQALFDFFGLPFHKNVENFIATHTQTPKPKNTYWSSTIRNSTETVFKWTERLSFETVEKIQNDCHGAMKLWGYKLAKSEDELKNDFVPITEYNLDATTY